ncbi:5-methyltetrahydrofolate--homocysteine methyltransferase [Rhizobiales bacterium GAS188]|nr:5-methyltetrahydrofolate--homocysteine methyltransferase [Rhizobiales bacterium GAS188]
MIGWSWAPAGIDDRKDVRLLTELLAERPFLLADGATGTNLFEMGLVSGEAPELWIDSHPDRIMALHQSFVDAGADLILTNTFGCNQRRLMLHDLQSRARELNRMAAQLARAVADKAPRRVIVAGSVGPTGDLLAPLGPLTEEEAVAVFAEQIAGLREGGAELAWIETMSAQEEMRAAARAAASLGMPYTLTASFDTAGRTMMGLAPAALPAFTATLSPQPEALGANCGVGASDLVMSVLDLAAGANGTPIIAKANAGIPRWQGAHIHYSGTPAVMGAYACLAYDAGARIIGGCCGTAPAHLAAMRLALDQHERRAPPSLEAVVAALGPLAQPPRAEGAEPRRRDRRRG